MAERKPLTHARQAETARPEAKPYNLCAGSGLYLEVMPTGAKRWRLRYRHLGKEKMLSLGRYPEIGLLEAKERRDAARTLLAHGINPSDRRREERAAAEVATTNSFEAVAKEWLGRQTDKADVTREKGRWLLSFAIAEFGQRPINEITPPHGPGRLPQARGRGKA